jgi:hypothetical protein
MQMHVNSETGKAVARVVCSQTIQDEDALNNLRALAKGYRVAALGSWGVIGIISSDVELLDFRPIHRLANHPIQVIGDVCL